MLVLQGTLWTARYDIDRKNNAFNLPFFWYFFTIFFPPFLSVDGIVRKSNALWGQLNPLLYAFLLIVGFYL